RCGGCARARGPSLIGAPPAGGFGRAVSAFKKLGTKTRADENESRGAPRVRKAEKGLFDDSPPTGRVLSPGAGRDMEPIRDLVGGGQDELEALRFAEPRGKPCSGGLCTRKLDQAGWNQCPHANVGRERLGKPAEILRGQCRDERGTEISS